MEDKECGLEILCSDNLEALSETPPFCEGDLPIPRAPLQAKAAQNSRVENKRMWSRAYNIPTGTPTYPRLLSTNGRSPLVVLHRTNTTNHQHEAFPLVVPHPMPRLYVADVVSPSTTHSKNTADVGRVSFLVFFCAVPGLDLST